MVRRHRLARALCERYKPVMARTLPALGQSPSILFVSATRIGDAVLSTGLFRHLVARYPDARFTIAAGPVAAPIFAGVPGLERLISLEKRTYSRHWLTLYRQVALKPWDLVVDLRGSALVWLLRAKERRVIGKQSAHEPRVEHLGRLFGLSPPPSPMLWMLPAHEDAAVRLVPQGGSVLGIGPTANWVGKIWRSEYFVELLRRLTARGQEFEGARIAVFAAPHERHLAAPVLEAIPPAQRIDLIGERDLLSVAACLQRLALFIGNDSGLMHLAAATGVPTLGLFGPSPVRQYAPWGDNTAVAATAISYEHLVGAADFNHLTTGTLMDSLSVDVVEAAALKLLARSRAAA